MVLPLVTATDRGPGGRRGGPVRPSTIDGVGAASVGGFFGATAGNCAAVRRRTQASRPGRGRHRLAREIHDGVAQSCMVGYGIDNALALAAGRTGPGREHARLAARRGHPGDHELLLSLFLSCRSDVDPQRRAGRRDREYARTMAPPAACAYTCRERGRCPLPAAVEGELLRMPKRRSPMPASTRERANLWVSCARSLAPICSPARQLRGEHHG